MAIELDHPVLDDRYELGQVLGSGGMGVVRSGWDRRLGRAVAIKMLRWDLAQQPQLRRRFEREAHMAARLSHPNAVAVFDVGEDSGTPYLVMEHVHGATLADQIGAGNLDVEGARRLAAAVLSALGAAHAAGIIHRDIKPSNILIAEDGAPKVTDFGIAKLIASDVTANLGTTEGLFGTVAYMAPERLRGAPATIQSDLYSVGAVLVEALTGHPPFRAENPAGLVLAVTTGERVPFADLRPDLDPAFVAAVERALAPRSEDRFATAEAMASAIGPPHHGGSHHGESHRAESHHGRPHGGLIPDGTSAGRTEDAPTIVAVSPAATEVLSPAPKTTGSPLRRPGPRVLATAAAAAVAIVTALALAGASSETSNDAPPAGSAGGTTTDTGIPPDLRAALDALEETLR